MNAARDAASAEVRARARAISRRTVRTARAARGARAGAWFALTLVTLGALDAVWPLGQAGRVVFALFALGALGRVVWGVALRRGRFDDAGVAGAGAARVGLDEERTRCAVEFALAQPRADPVARALERRAIERGLAALRSLDIADAVDTKPARRSLTALGFAAACVLVIAVVAPRAALVEMVRLADPLGDHPAYSRTLLTLTVGPADLRVGDAARVVVTVVGDRAGSAALVAQREDGPIERLALAESAGESAGDERVATLRDVRDSIRVRAEAGLARTRWRRIDPSPKPRLVRARATIEAPAYAHRAPTVVALPALGIPTVLEGSMIRVSAQCSMDVAEVRAPEAEKTTAQGRSARAQWLAGSPGESRLFLDAVSAAGLGLDEPIGVVVSVHADTAPEARIIEPAGARVLAAARSRVRFTVTARDDIGVASLIAEARATDAQQWRATALDLAPAGSGWVGMAEITPTDFGALPGGRLFVRFVARDGRPKELGGPNSTIAGPVEIVVVGDDAFAAGGGGAGSRAGGATGAGGKRAGARDGAGQAGDGHAGGSPGNGGEHHSVAPDGSEGVAGDGGSADGEKSKATGGGGAGRGSDGGSTGRASGSRDGAGRRSAIGVGLRAIGFGGDGAEGAALDPSLMNRLNERDRGVVARYFELLASAPAEREPRRRSAHE